MGTRLIPWRTRRLALCASAGTALAVLAGATWSGGAGAAARTSHDPAGVTLSAGPLGIDLAPWDSVYSGSATLSGTQALLKAAHITQLHYGGGVSADQYDWQTNTDISSCFPNTSMAAFTAACAYKAALPFDKFSTNARALGAQSFVTVNYGSGTPAMAAAWVTQAQSTAGQGVADWEIGNESYGCWENNNELADPPEDYVGYEANVSSTCPMTQPAGVDAGMGIMANSYAYNAGLYMQAMQAADPSVQLGVPWAFNGVGGASVQDNTEWNDTVLGDRRAVHQLRRRALLSIRLRRRHRSGQESDGSAGDPVGRADSGRLHHDPSHAEHLRPERDRSSWARPVSATWPPTSPARPRARCSRRATRSSGWPRARRHRLVAAGHGRQPGTPSAAYPDEAMFTNTGQPDSPYTVTCSPRAGASRTRSSRR